MRSFAEIDWVRDGVTLALTVPRSEVGQTFLSAGSGDFLVASGAVTPDWKVRRTGRLESLPYASGQGEGERSTIQSGLPNPQTLKFYDQEN